ncbi:MAG: hypothetical protein ACKOJI_01755, partial [Phycisphaerales bacterium]
MVSTVRSGVATRSYSVGVAFGSSTGRLVQMGYVGRDTQQRVVSLTMDAVDHAGPEALRLPTQWVVYPTGEKEGTMGPKARITVGPAASAPAASPAAPSTPPAPAAPAPARRGSGRTAP